MRKQPALTFEGALRILGKHEPAAVGKLDKLLGGVILGAGVAGAIAVPALAPLALLWGWVDQKNEAISLLRGLTQKMSTKLAGVSGLERRDLVAAAHTAIAVSAYFEVFEETVGKKMMKSFTLNEKDRGFRSNPANLRDLNRLLYTDPVPALSPLRGFEENTGQVRHWCVNLHSHSLAFLDCIEAWPHDAYLESELFLLTVLRRYESHYVDLAAQVPEFLIWTTLSEHAATRTKIKDFATATAAAFDTQAGALGRMETLLSLVADNQAPISDLRATLRRANHGVLSRPVVSHDSERYDTDVVFPTIKDIFVSPRFRLGYAGKTARPADETWWQELPVFDDLDLLLARYLTTPEATVSPLVVLGHPGAGKSLLTKVIAARLPAADYTVVRVPLRSVGANLPIADQVQAALNAATHGRISWPELTDQSADTVRVVLLDGLDELLQATQFDRNGYLQEIAEFQRIEAEQDRPVAVVVTSRTVVADRVDTKGATMVKLEDFDDEQMATWLRVWHETNRTAIESGTIRCLTLDEARHQSELARQPLLLMMLALYAADPESPKLDEGLSQAALYERIIDNFARREVAKHDTRPRDFAARVEEQITRLSITALGMFNRGAQTLREKDLQLDLQALDGAEEGGDDGKRLLGEFFFVHAAEATLLSGSARKDVERSYEFLHATMGEFLVARYVMNTLRDIADAAYGGKRGHHTPKDDLLYAVLSHHAIAGRSSIAAFTVDLFFDLDPAEQSVIRKTLTTFIDSYQRRLPSKEYLTYRPTPRNQVRELAAYSANLVCLAVGFGLNQVAGELFLCEEEEAMRTWYSTVALWRAGLDVDSSRTMFSLVRLDTDDRLYPYLDGGPQSFDILEAQATGDSIRARRERFGQAVLEGVTFYDDANWEDAVLSWIVPMTGDCEAVADELFIPPPEDTPPEQLAAVKRELMALIRASAARTDEHVDKWVRYLLDLPEVLPFDEGMVLSLANFHPKVLAKYPELQVEFEKNPRKRGLVPSDKSAGLVHLEDLQESLFLMMGGKHILTKPPVT